MLALSDQTDENGRLLLEDSAPPAALAKADRVGVPRTIEICNYADTPSRVGGRMNASALEVVRRDTAGVLNGACWLAERLFDLEPTRTGCVQGLADVSHLGVTLPVYLMGRSESAFGRYGSLPSSIGSLFKASRGVYSAAVDMVDKHGGRCSVTAADVAAFADREGHMRRQQTDRVCAAPTKLLERTIQVMLTGDGASPEKSDLEGLVDFHRFYDFYLCEADLSRALSSYGRVLNALAESVAGFDPREMFAYAVPVEDGFRSFGDLTEEMLRRLNESQAQLNRILGRSGSAGGATFEDLLDLL